MGEYEQVGVAYAQRAWGEVFAQLTAADADRALGARQLEQLAVAAHCIGRMADST